MAIRTKPNEGDTIIINKKYFDDNILIAQYFPNLVHGKPFEIVKIVILIDDIWGISSLRDTDTGEVMDISTVDELKDYWCILDADDSYRVVPNY
ncbi:hypothetical protein ACX818_001339 [Acinetobacter baumannii]